MISIDSMISFPLYDSMIRSISTRDLTSKQKSDLAEKICNLDQAGIDLVYALIRCFFIKNTDNEDMAAMPYKGVIKSSGKNKEDITWNLADMPIELRQLLYKFVNVHLASVQETERDQ